MSIAVVTACWGRYAGYLHDWLLTVSRLVPPATEVVVAGTVPPGHLARWVRWDTDPEHPADALNSAIAAVDCEWILAVDVDDTLLPDALDFDTGCDVAAAGLRYDHGGEWVPGKFSASKLLAAEDNLLPAASPFRRALWEQVGGYHAADGWVYDWGLWRRMAAAAATFEPIGRVTYLHHDTPGSWSETKQNPADVARIKEIR